MLLEDCTIIPAFMWFPPTHPIPYIISIEVTEWRWERVFMGWRGASVSMFTEKW